MSNNISEKWYRVRRTDVDDRIEDGKILSDKRKEYVSPKEKYVLSITPVAFKEDGRYWAYTIGKVYKKLKDRTGEHVCTVYRLSLIHI